VRRTNQRLGAHRRAQGTGARALHAGRLLLLVDARGQLHRKSNTQFFAENAPKVLNNGLVIGSGPDEEEFDQPGSGELESEALLGLKFAGTVKVEGYGLEEPIEVKNP
jgi:hypothetical protein